MIHKMRQTILMRAESLLVSATRILKNCVHVRREQLKQCREAITATRAVLNQTVDSMRRFVAHLLSLQAPRTARGRCSALPIIIVPSAHP